MALKRIKANMHIIYAVILAGFLFATVQGFFTVGPVIGDVDGELYTEPSSAQIGNLIWTRTWGGSDADDSFTLWKYGDYIYTAGGTFSYGDPNGDVTIVKWDTQGNLIWNITWGGSEWETAHDIIVVNEYIYVLGETMSYGHGASDMLLLKYDTDGNLIWNTTYGGTDSDCGTALWTDGNYLYAVGGTASFGDGSNNVWVMKIDFDGNSIWDTTWGFGGYSSGEGIFADSTGVYVTGASDSIDGSGSDEGVIIKYDLSGNLIWNDTFGNPGKFDFPEDMWGNEKGIYIIADSEQNDETNDV